MITLCIFLTELIKFLIFFRYCLKERFKRLWGIPIFLILFMIMTYYEMPKAFSAVIVCVLSLFFMTKNIYGKIVISAVFLSSISDVLMIFIRKIPTNSNNSISEVKCYLATNVIIIILLLIYKLLIKKSKWVKINISVNIVYVVLGVVIWIMTLTITLLQYMIKNIHDKTDIKLIEIFSLLAFLSIFILLFVVLHIYHLNERLKEAYIMECNLKEAQETYYQVLLSKEEETRKYRHDLSNHIICLKQITKQGRLTDVNDYLNSIYQKFSLIEHTVYDTGNEIFNIMLNYLVGTATKKVDMHITGKATKKIAADNFTLCTIFSNVLRNAIEELNQIHKEELVLQIKIRDGNSYVKIEISNTSRDKEIKNGNIETIKTDKKNHGIGLENVRKAINECHGILELSYIDEMFVTRIYLPYASIEE